MPERIARLPYRRALLAAVLLATLLPAVPALRTPAHAAPAWLNRLNSFRVQAGMRPVGEAERLESGIANHSRYVVKTDDYSHGEDRSSPYYTESGHEAGTRSNMTVRRGGAGNEVDDVDKWLAAPFHALGVLHPQLRGTSYASYHEASSPGYTYAAGLDVLTHRDGRDSADYPVVFPGDGMVVPVSMTEAADEVPSPLAPCGYSMPAGLPVIVSFGPTVAAPVVTSYSLTRDGVPVEACATTSGDYADRTARVALDDNHTVLVIPRAPLAPGGSYTAKVTASGITETTTFSVARIPSAVAIDIVDADLNCGDTVDVFARLDTGYGNPARQTLQLWGRGSYGNRPWQLLQSVATGPDGRAVFSGARPGGTSEYQVRYAGNAANLPSRSAVRTVVVHAIPWKVTARQHEYVLVMADSMIVPGDTGVGGGARLGLMVQDVDGSWRTVENVGTTADSDGYFEMTIPLGKPGRFTYSVYAYASGCHRSAMSDPLTVTVVMSSSA